MTEVSRRSAVKTLGAGAIAMTIIDSAAAAPQASSTPSAPAFSGGYQPKPLKSIPRSWKVCRNA